LQAGGNGVAGAHTLTTGLQAGGNGVTRDTGAQALTGLQAAGESPNSKPNPAVASVPQPNINAVPRTHRIRFIEALLVKNETLLRRQHIAGAANETQHSCERGPKPLKARNASHDESILEQLTCQNHARESAMCLRRLKSSLQEDTCSDRANAAAFETGTQPERSRASTPTVDLSGEVAAGEQWNFTAGHRKWMTSQQESRGRNHKVAAVLNDATDSGTVLALGETHRRICS